MRAVYLFRSMVEKQTHCFLQQGVVGLVSRLCACLVLQRPCQEGRRARRVKESCRILSSMMNGEVDSFPDQDSYCLVVRVLYLTGRIVKGNRIVDRMIKNGVGVKASENVDSALEMFERMKKCCTENLGPTYDLLIEKLCRNGKFDAGRSLYGEAVENGIILQISRDLLDPLKMPVFKPKRRMMNSVRANIRESCCRNTENLTTEQNIMFIQTNPHKAMSLLSKEALGAADLINSNSIKPLDNCGRQVSLEANGVHIKSLTVGKTEAR
ncbi:hypothetical protein HPP92_018764 [Vanilla planifolia]|uniref:Pentatricopeptide repeat-containing protein n=1 Tax=Vanilla planifolia TaxID=51239 RepID=A0A835UL36_VANPL|nr:hypothetical protein HPP92_018764 [Vanilla planifolia]